MTPLNWTGSDVDILVAYYYRCVDKKKKKGDARVSRWQVSDDQTNEINDLHSVAKV